MTQPTLVIPVDAEDNKKLNEQELCAHAIYQHDVPSTTQEWQDKLDQGWQNYGHLFRNRNECELFTMLPLNDTQRFELLKKMIDEKKYGGVNETRKSQYAKSNKEKTTTEESA